MTLEQLNSLNEDEVAMLWYIVNKLNTPVLPGVELEPNLFPSIRKPFLIHRIIKAEESIVDTAKPIYAELKTKLGISEKQ